MIGTRVPELSFLDFIVALAPVAIVTLLVVTGLLYLVFRKQLVVSPERIAELERLDPARDVRESRYVKRAVGVLLGTIVVFFLHAPLHLEPAVVALGGATVLLLVASDDVEQALERIEWSTLFFFIGLFVMVGALEEQGVIEQIAGWLAEATGSPAGQGMAVLWGSAAGSALVDNIPFTAAMIPVVEQLQAENAEFDPGLWWALALGACFGGNATMIAAAANVAATGVLERSGHRVSFARFLAVGVPMTLVSLAIATVYLLLFFF